MSKRRRRVAGVLAGTTAAFAAAAALSGAATLLVLAALAAVLAVTYGAAAVWVDRRAAQRNLDFAFKHPAANAQELGWDQIDPDLRVQDLGGLGLEEPVEAEMGWSAAVRFLAAYFAAWVLTPLVILLQLISGERVNIERYEVIRRLIGFQAHWRSRSLRMAGVAAMSTMTVVGAASGTAFASSYTVQPGNDLVQIARANGTTVSALAALNDIDNPNLIFPGQVIDLGNVSYTVRWGDTLASIARSHGTTVAALASANGIANPNLIIAGSTLTLPNGNPPSASSSGGLLAVQTALAQLGVPYVWAGASPSQGFDCSGLVEYAWAAAGVSLPHNSVAQWYATTRISESQLQPGDIVFYNNGADEPQPGHEALYIGNGQVVSANYPGSLVQTQSINWVGPPMGFGRVG